MIPRYECPEISEIWSETTKYKTFLQVEVALLKALEKAKRIPKNIALKIEKKAVINPARIDEIEKQTKHDLIAFCTSITEQFDVEVAKYFHYGVTSSDIIDTSVNLQIKSSLEVILPELKTLRTTLKKFALQHKNLICMGRSHGMFAEPMSFGQKFLSFYAEFSRRYDELFAFHKNDLTGQLSGAVGNYCILDPQIEKSALSQLGLKSEPVSTQVIPRDRIAKLISINALIASAIERICVEIRHLHHSDIDELHEGFTAGQKGSSTMPHKKNPIAAENLSGMARVIRSHLTIAHENIALWHERDISHSSTERMYLPDHLNLVYYAIKRLNSTVKNLQVHNEKIEQKVKDNFGYLSSFYLHYLIDNTEAHREVIYEIVQKAAFEAKSAKDFTAFIQKYAQEKQLALGSLPVMNEKQIKKIYLAQTAAVYARVDKEYPLK